MGQQQLLLLVLATIIVGIATVVGIQAFSQNNVKSNADAMMNDAVRIASDAQAWVQKSAPFGGPPTFGDFSDAGLDFEALGYEENTATAGEYRTLNGTCTLTAQASPVINCVNDELENEVEVTIDNTVDNGLSDASIDGEVVRLGTP